MSSHALSRHARPESVEPPSRSNARATLAHALTAGVGKQAIVTVCVPAPVAAIDALLQAAPANASMLWDPVAGPSFSGLGVAAVVPPDRHSVQSFFATLDRDGTPESTPRLFGGIAFAPGAADQSPWTSFGDGALLLPRWTYEVADTASLSLAFDGSVADAQSIDEALVEFDGIWNALLAPEATMLPRLQVGACRTEPGDAWAKQVLAIRDRITAGTVRKVVAARHTVLELAQPGDARTVLAQLKQRFPGCTRFAFWRDGAAFIGATPEFLVARHGAKVVTEALAGSVERGRADALLQSPKERDEHQLVVDVIVQALKPFCIELHTAPQPRIRELPNLLHMQTPIEGRLRRETHVLDLVRALHPTPAVGGVPTKQAVDWILTHESVSRGWYSAPIGWVDEHGDGEFAVALRSGLMHGQEVWVYAGAGIMRDSDPTAEYAETELKMQALLGAVYGAGQEPPN